MVHVRPAVAALSLALAAAPAAADGYLWLGSEFQAEGTVFRYNLQTGTIDRTVAIPRPSGVGHWNNIATDGERFYIGAPNSQYVGVCDPDTGDVLDSYSYSPSLAGHKEDGAFRADTGNLWRVTFSSSLHEVTAAGALVRTFSGGGALVGLEWVGDTLYATNYSGGDIGTLSLDTTAMTSTFTIIPWAPGGPAITETAGLAYDADSGILYMAANRHHLWSVTFESGMAHATHIADLSTLGFPAGGLIDGMGWIGTPSPCPADYNGDMAVNSNDISAYLTAWLDSVQNGNLIADFNGDDQVNSNDISAFLTAWLDAVQNGC